MPVTVPIKSKSLQFVERKRRGIPKKSRWPARKVWIKLADDGSIAKARSDPDARERPRRTRGGIIVAASRPKVVRRGSPVGGVSLSQLEGTRAARGRRLGHRFQF